MKLYELFKKEYIESGYAYSGALSYHFLLKHKFTNEDINKLLNKNIIQTRNCEIYSFQLTKDERKKLIIENSLKERWESDKTALSFYPFSLDLDGEYVKVMLN